MFRNTMINTLNETIIQTPELIAKANLFDISLIGTWVLFVVLFAIAGLSFKSKNSGWGNFWNAWLLASFLTAIPVIFFLIAPEQSLSFINSIFGNI